MPSSIRHNGRTHSHFIERTMLQNFDRNDPNARSIEEFRNEISHRPHNSFETTNDLTRSHDQYSRRKQSPPAQQMAFHHNNNMGLTTLDTQDFAVPEGMAESSASNCDDQIIEQDEIR